MFFYFDQVPQAQPADLAKSFDHLSTPPEIAMAVSQIEQSRNHFYGTMNQLSTKQVVEIVENFETGSLL